MPQLWRPLVGPVNESPLALFDARSVGPDDLMDLRMDLPPDDPRARVTGTGSSAAIYISKHNASESSDSLQSLSGSSVLAEAVHVCGRGFSCTDYRSTCALTVIHAHGLVIFACYILGRALPIYS